MNFKILSLCHALKLEELSRERRVGDHEELSCLERELLLTGVCGRLSYGFPKMSMSQSPDSVDITLYGKQTNNQKIPRLCRYD